MEDLKSRSFWSKPPLERSQIAAERLKLRMTEFNVTQDQVAHYTRMDLPRLQSILDGNVIMGIDEFMDIYQSIPDADESLITDDNLYHHRLMGLFKKIAWLKDGWNGEGTKGIPERLARRFQHHLRFVKDSHLQGWLLSITNDGQIRMKRNEQEIILSWETIRHNANGNDTSMSFTKENFSGLIELCHIYSS